MARFAQYQCIGTMSAGEAFLKAKCDYYNSSRGIEEDEIILGTVLHVQPLWQSHAENCS